MMRFVSLAAVWLSFAGCMPPESSGVKTIKMTMWGQPSQVLIERKIIAAFEKQNPSIHVEVIHITTRYEQKLKAMIAGHAAPDLMMMEQSVYPGLATAGALLRLDGADPQNKSDPTKNYLASDPLDLDDMFDLPNRLSLFDGKRFGLCTNAVGQVLFYNEDHFTKAGVEFPNETWTWDDFLAAAKRLSEKPPTVGTAGKFYAAPGPPSNIVFWSCGGEVVDDLYHPTRCAAMEPAGIEGLRLAERMANSPGIRPASVTDDGGTYQNFMNGKLAMMFNGRWIMPQIEGMKYKWNVAPMPKGPRGRITEHGGSLFGISTQSRHPDEAWKLVRFYTSREATQIAMEGGRSVPVYKSMVNSPAYLNLKPGVNMAVFSDTMLPGAARSIAYTPLKPQLNAAFSQGTDELTRGMITPERAAARICYEVKLVLQRDREAQAP